LPGEDDASQQGAFRFKGGYGYGYGYGYGHGAVRRSRRRDQEHLAERGSKRMKTSCGAIAASIAVRLFNMVAAGPQHSR
jgi:hypothetical protein